MGIASGFNRTFMELKSKEDNNAATVAPVLIVPLWNWNKLEGSEKQVAWGFNRTFMELKLM